MRKAAVVTKGLQQQSGQQQVASAAAMEGRTNTDAEKGAKKADKILCFHYGQTRHMAEMPKPMAKLYGLCRSELMIYDVPASDELQFRHDSGKVARITVDGGNMRAQQVATELGWIVPGEHQWSLEKVEENVYKTVFPTKVDLARLVKFSTVPIDAAKGLFLIFEEWSSAPMDNFKLEEAWVRVSGCPYQLRCDYLALFGVGSLIGIPLEVDMEYTRKHGVARMFVQVTAISYIPPSTDHTYKGVGYVIKFEVEGYTLPESKDETMEEADLDGDDKQLKEGNHESHSDKTIERNQQDILGSKSSGNAPQSHGSKVQNLQNSASLLTSSPGIVPLTVVAPKRLWSDRVDVEEGLPSPLARSAPARLDFNMSESIVVTQPCS
ncbi:hypothetical protein ACQ4PT_063464 [Festuca glaucescens]